MRFLVVSFLSLTVLSGSLFAPLPQFNHSANIEEFLNLIHTDVLCKLDEGLISALKEHDEPTSFVFEMSDGQQNIGCSQGVFPTPVVTCLLDIADRKKKEHREIKVADLCCGNGHIIWKALLLGASCTAVDKTEDGLKKVQDIVQKIQADIDLPAKSFKILKGDVLKFFQKDKYKHLFDVTWSGMCLYLFSPSDLRQYVHGLFDVTAPGGSAYVTVRTPIGKKQVACFNKIKQDGLSTPAVYFSLVAEGKKFFEAKKQSDFLTMDCIKTQEGRYLETPPQTFYQRPLAIQEGVLPAKFRSEKSLCITMCTFDHELLRKLFANTGFEVNCVYYYNDQGVFGEDFELGSQDVYLAIHAKKPEQAATGAAS